MLYPFLLSTPVPVIIGKEGGGILNQWEYFNQRANELERYNYKTPGVNVADPDGSVWKKRREIDNAQLQTAAKLEKLQEQFEQSQIEQAKENRVDRWFAIASLVVAVVSLAVAILK
jgi:hypothetical protein